jgi:hypothetical protein
MTQQKRQLFLMHPSSAQQRWFCPQLITACYLRQSLCQEGFASYSLLPFAGKEH